MGSEQQVQYAYYRDFQSSLGELWRKGGKFQKAADQITTIRGRIGTSIDPFLGFALTNHGESRIPHCVKYDLQGACRLITVKDRHVCVFLFCGDHATCDLWLESNRGLVPIVGQDNMITVTYVSDSDSSRPKVGGASGFAKGKLYERIDEKIFDRLSIGLPRKLTRQIEQFDSTSTDTDLWLVLNDVATTEQRHAIFDVLSLLRQDKVKQAQRRAELFLGAASFLGDVPVEQLPDIVDSDVIRRIRPEEPHYAEAITRFMKTAGYRDWMLFMHPAQESVVNEDFDGAAKLLGVSGSGKTCVIVQRAVRLARLYPNERILVLTLNRALAALIETLVQSCCTDEELKQIEVRPFFELCRLMILEFEPYAQRLYDDKTWKINEHVDEIWEEYYQCRNNNFDAAVLAPVHDSLLSRGWAPERYLREEADWLRSALRPDSRDTYLEMQRVGRTLPLPRAFRAAVLEGLRGWEQKMLDIGVIDHLGIVQALTKHIDQIKPRYRAVLVDEAQDFGNVELEIVRRLVPEGPNDLFFCGDAAQAVTTKYQSLKTIGMSIPAHRSRKLVLNYRNSREVLSAAYDVLLVNLTEELLDREDFDILDPEYSAFSATTPLLLEGDDLAQEIACAVQYSVDALNDRPHGRACIAICGHSLREVSHFGKRVKLPVLDGLTNMDSGQIFLSDLEQTKGFEFDVMIVVNCAEGILPSASCPENERFRDLARLYVAMTRAKSDLVLSWSGARSQLLSDTKDHFLHARWSDYFDVASITSIGTPSRLDGNTRSTRPKRSWREMTGAQFLYEEAALGLDVALIAKLRDLVDGKGLRRSAGRRIKWQNLGTASKDFRLDPFCRKEWGPEVGKLFSDLVERLEAASRTA